MQKQFFILMAAFAMTIFGVTTANAQCSGHKSHTSYNSAHHHTQQNIVDIAIESDDFSTLVTAVKAAGLVDAIKDSESITLFAPTNAAFSKIPADNLNSLLEPSNKETLSSILTYHVVPGKFDAASILNAIELNGGETEIKTLSGSTLTAYVNNGDVLLRDANGNVSAVTKTDISASNGVIHVIDTVVIP